MTQDLIRAVAQLGDRRIRRVILLTLCLTLAASAALVLAATIALGTLELSGIGFIDWMLGLVGGLAAAFVAWMLFPVLASELLYLFLDEVADAVEARHYPKLPRAAPAPAWRYALAGLRLLLVMALFNLLILPLSFVPFANIVYPLVYLAVNGMLLGREFWEVVAPRRMSFAAARALRRKHRFKVFVSGVVIALLFTVPVLNLLAPVIATAFAVHVHRRIADGKAGGGTTGP